MPDVHLGISKVHIILSNPGVTHSVPTAFIMNAVGTEWVTPGLPRMGSYLISVSYIDDSSILHSI